MNQKPRGLTGSDGVMMSELTYKTLKEISDRLDLLKDGKTAYWRELAMMMDYNHIAVEKFGMQASKQAGSPGYSLLMDMSNKGVSYDELISYLKRLELFEALAQIGYKEDVRITKHPVATPVMSGQKLRLECRAEGVPRPQYMWFHGRTALENQRSPILEIDKVTPDHAGIYTCRVGNTANIMFSKWVEVQVQNPTNKGPVAENGYNEDSPVITEHPEPAMLEVGQQLFLTCQAEAGSKLEFQWFLNGSELVYAKQPDLVIKEVQMSDRGVYVCCVKSANGTSVLTKGAEVVVNRPGNQVISQPAQPPHPANPPLPNNQQQFVHGPQVTTPFMDTSYSIPIIPEYQPMNQIPTHAAHGGPGGMMGQEEPPFHHMMHSPDEPMRGPPYSGGGATGVGSRVMNLGEPGPSFPQPGPQAPRTLPPPTPNSLSPNHNQKLPPLVTDDGAGGQDAYIMDKPCADKVALLIGNKNYHVRSLKLNTPENDTQDLAGILRSADFKVVSLVNLTKKEMDDAIEYFVKLLGPNVYAVFFFAGHGFEFNSMNYMMAVDCTKQKNPSYSVCTQKVLQMMQETKAKLSVVLLDMCRVVAPQDPITDLSGIYKQPYPAKSYPGYHLYVFSCSLAEKAFEVDAGEGNSIFVAVLKEYLQKGNASISEPVKNLFDAIAKGVHERKPNGVTGQWQRPEISSNVAEDLTLTDTIDTTLLPKYQEWRSNRWKDAHSVLEPLVVGSKDGHLALRLHFEAEHTNVLLLRIEVLQGCLMETEIEQMTVELVLQEKPVSLILAGTTPQLEYGPNSSISVQKSLANKNLLHFKIPDLQKITTPKVTLHISTNYRWRDNRKEGTAWHNWQFQMEHINHIMTPPLYGKITHQEEEERRKQHQIQYDQQCLYFSGSGPTPGPGGLRPVPMQ